MLEPNLFWHKGLKKEQMEHYFNLTTTYLRNQASIHNLNPLLFGILYLLSKLLFLLFIGIAAKRLKKNGQLLLPLLFAALGYSLPYLYMVIAGKNIPFWVFLVITLIYLFSGWAIYKKLRKVKLNVELENS